MSAPGATPAALPGRRRAVYCRSCTDAGRRGYCAPAGCYCGHADCYAAASWRPLPVVAAKQTRAGEAARAAHAEAWASREGPSWIDQI